MGELLEKLWAQDLTVATVVNRQTGRRSSQIVPMYTEWSHKPTPWLQALAHLRDFFPGRYAKLKASGKLEEYLDDLAERYEAGLDAAHETGDLRLFDETRRRLTRELLLPEPPPRPEED
jgi:hypothetical protein